MDQLPIYLQFQQTNLYRSFMFSAPIKTLQNLWHHRSLLRQFTLRQLEMRHKGSHLGLVWSFLSPLLMLMIYVLVFGYIFHGNFQGHAQESRAEYALAVFLSLAIFHFVAEVIGVSPTLILGSPNFVKKVVFPLEVLPTASVGAAFIHFMITLCLVVLAALVTQVSIKSGIFLLPVIILPLLGISLGIAFALSSLGVFWRDLLQITQPIILILMYASAVFFPPSLIPPAAWAILKFNPMLHLINESRKIVFWGEAINLSHLSYLYAFSALIFIAGTTLFQRSRNSFADVL